MISAPEHLSRALGPYDDPRTWKPRTGKPLFDSVAFQKQINRITGTDDAVKILWAPHWEEWKPRIVGATITDETVPAHSALNDSKGNPVAPPRWMAVERIEPEQWLPNWDKNRWFRDPRDSEFYDLRGPAPAERFQFLFTIADHDDHCCEKRMRKTLVCWGYYRDPNSQDLFEIKARWSKSMADPVDPHRSIEGQRETQHERDTVTQMQRERQERREEVRLRLKDRLTVYDPSQLKHLRNAMIQRYVVAGPGKKIHRAVEKQQEIENEHRLTGT